MRFALVLVILSICSPNLVAQLKSIALSAKQAQASPDVGSAPGARVGRGLRPSTGVEALICLEPDLQILPYSIKNLL